VEMLEKRITLHCSTQTPTLRCGYTGTQDIREGPHEQFEAKIEIQSRAGIRRIMKWGWTYWFSRSWRRLWLYVLVTSGLSVLMVVAFDTVGNLCASVHGCDLVSERPFGSSGSAAAESFPSNSLSTCCFPRTCPGVSTYFLLLRSRMDPSLRYCSGAWTILLPQM
jgi:hypothetical protein